MRETGVEYNTELGPNTKSNPKTVEFLSYDPPEGYVVATSDSEYNKFVEEEVFLTDPTKILLGIDYALNSVPPPPENQRPTAIIDDVTKIFESDSSKQFSADGSRSSDSDGSIASYQWLVVDEQIPTSGDCRIVNGYETGVSTKVEIRSDVEGETVYCTFGLQVTDNDGAVSKTDTFTRSKTCSGICLIEK